MAINVFVQLWQRISLDRLESLAGDVYRSLRRLSPELVAGLCMLLGIAPYSFAGPYAAQAGLASSTAIAADSAAIVAWASGHEGYTPNNGSVDCLAGTALTSQFMSATKALGPAGNSDGSNAGFTFDTVSLGRGGCITLTFAGGIGDGVGADFAVFENGLYQQNLNQAFLELAWVEVSSDGFNFFRFPAISLTAAPVGAFQSSLDASDLNGFAGKYIAGFGTPFDLDDLADHPLLDKQAVTHVRIIDVIGDGNALDDSQPARPIYDPYATAASAGFDLDAIAVLHQALSPAPAPELNVPLPGIMQFFIAILILLAANRTRGLQQ